MSPSAIGGTHQHQGRLLFYNGDKLQFLLGSTTEIPPDIWHHVVLVRDGRRVAIDLNGNRKPKFSGEAAPGVPPSADQLFVGGRNDNRFNFEGKIDEAAIYNRALAPEEIYQHHTTARPR